MNPKCLLNGDEALAAAAFDAGVALGTGYPGTPSTEILEAFSLLGGRAQWAPNEKVALEVAAGVAFAGSPVICTMKHVGVNVAADSLFTIAYTGVTGPLVLVSADDPGMHSSQNEQDNRNFASAAGVPMFEPADSQETYDFFFAALELSRKWGVPVLFRMTTRVCHGKSIVARRQGPPIVPPPANFVRSPSTRVMIPAHAKPAHRKLRQKLAEIAQYSETSPCNVIYPPETQGDSLGIISCGIAACHAREAAPNASILKLGFSYPLPFEKIRAFAKSVKRCVVIEEGDPWLTDAIRAQGIAVETKNPMYRFGELNVDRVKRILNNDVSPEPAPAKGKPPSLCVSCPYHPIYATFKKLDCIVSGDIGCYTLGVLPPYQAMDFQTCMGASIGTALGLRHVLPVEQAKRVVSVIGDSTFIHSGLTGIAEMVYNAPATGHVVVILDNGTTAMTGRQEHPGTGRTLSHEPAGKVIIENVIKAMGVPNVDVIDGFADPQGFENLLKKRLEENTLSVIISRRPCLLAAGKIKQYEQANASKCSCNEGKPQ